MSLFFSSQDHQHAYSTLKLSVLDLLAVPYFCLRDNEIALFYKVPICFGTLLSLSWNAIVAFKIIIHPYEI